MPGELVKSIEAPKDITGAELMQAAGIGPTKREADREKAVKQDQKSSISSKGPSDSKSQESTGSSYGDAVNKRYEERIANAPANLRDDVGYQNKVRKIAELEVRKGKKVGGRGCRGSRSEPAPKEKCIGQKIAGFFGFGGEESKPTPKDDLDSRAQASQVSSSQQAPVAQKAGFGDKVGSFFGGIKDSVVGAAGKVGAAVGTAGAAVGSFASGLKDKVASTAQ